MLAGPVTLEKRGIATAVLTAFREICELRPMYCELGPHTAPHFHAYHGDDQAVYGLDPIELLTGSLQRRQARLVEARAELPQSELIADWERLQAGTEPLPIDPLP
jgi:hypothetical protein